MSPAQSRRAGPPWVTLALLALLAVAAALIVLFVRPPPPLERSAIGYDGLARWLTAQDMPVEVFGGAGPLASDGVGLRILALYDSDPTEIVALSPETPFDRDLLADMSFVTAPTIAAKVADIPTVIIWPKWRDGVRLRGVRHRELLINAGAGDPPVELVLEGSAERVLREAGFVAEDSDEARTGEAEEITIVESETGADAADDGEPAAPDPLVWPRLLPVGGDVRRIEEISAPGRLGGRVRLAAPQYAQAGEACEALVGDAMLGLVFECRWGEVMFWVVSDPDLLNNHGLTDPANRRFATALVERLRGEAAAGAVLIDYSTHNWVIDGEPRGRELSDLLRYFQAPFIWLWLAAALMFAAAVWRGAVREQPLATVFAFGHGATRRIAFQAQARLMRATGRDGALLRALAAARAAALCDVMLGRDERGGARTERMLVQLTRRDESLGARLSELLSAIAQLPDRLPADAAERTLHHLETLYQEARASAGAESPR